LHPGLEWSADDSARLRGGHVLEVEPFFDEEVATALAMSLVNSAATREVRARAPVDAGKVVGYAPHVSPADWDALAPAEQFLRFSQLEGSDLTSDASVVAYLGSTAFRDTLSSLSALSLTESYFDIHIMRRGDFIHWHSDAREGRQLGLIVYLSPAWDEARGGVLEARIEGAERRFVPVFNRAIVFGVDALATHRVTQVEHDEPRLSLGMWFI
jgi:hypothetical protein